MGESLLQVIRDIFAVRKIIKPAEIRVEEKRKNEKTEYDKRSQRGAA
ncbi:MAG: hypothetical protein ACLSHJ_04605 [Oscillospiraceae bacterium]